MTTPADQPAKQIVPLDPGSPAGKATAESLSQALAEILVDIEQRRDAAKDARP